MMVLQVYNVTSTVMRWTQYRLHTATSHLITHTLIRRCFQMRNSMEKKIYSQQWKKTHDSIVKTSHEHTACMRVWVCAREECSTKHTLANYYYYYCCCRCCCRLPQDIFSSFTKISLAIMCVRAIFPCSIHYYYYIICTASLCAAYTM